MGREVRTTRFRDFLNIRVIIFFGIIGVKYIRQWKVSLKIIQEFWFFRMIDWREIKSICTLKISKIIIYNDILYYCSESVDCLIVKNHVARLILSFLLSSWRAIKKREGMKSRTIELKFNITNLMEFCIFFLFFFLAERRKGAGCVVEARPATFYSRNETKRILIKRNRRSPFIQTWPLNPSFRGFLQPV